MDRVASVGEDAESRVGRGRRPRPPHSGRQPVGVRSAGPIRAHDEPQISAGNGDVERAPVRPAGSGPASEAVRVPGRGPARRLAVEEPVRERTGLFRVAGVPEPHAKGGPVAAPADLRVDPVSGTRGAAPRGLRHAAGRPVQDLLLRQVLRIRRVQVPVARIFAPEGALAGTQAGVGRRSGVSRAVEGERGPAVSGRVRQARRRNGGAFGDREEVGVRRHARGRPIDRGGRPVRVQPDPLRQFRPRDMRRSGEQALLGGQGGLAAAARHRHALAAGGQQDREGRRRRGARDSGLR